MSIRVCFLTSRLSNYRLVRICISLVTSSNMSIFHARLWSRYIAFEEAVVQVAGSAVRMRSTVLKKTVQRRASPLLTLLLLYTRTLMKQVMQTAACNRLHSEKERLARWLLMCRDRMESDDLPLTQDFLSDVLGLPRATITNAATDIQAKGMIRYTPGSIKILKRKRLEALACECYRVVTVNGDTSGLKSNSSSLRSSA